MVKSKRKRIKKALDRFFSEIIRMDKSDSRGYCTCVTCGKKQKRYDIQNGHYVGRKYLNSRRSYTNCRPQCVGCNCMLNGNYIQYTLFMLSNVFDTKEELEEYIKKCKQKTTIKTTDMEKILYNVYSQRRAHPKAEDSPKGIPTSNWTILEELGISTRDERIERK